MSYEFTFIELSEKCPERKSNTRILAEIAKVLHVEYNEHDD